MAEVTQADREAAARWAKSQSRHQQSANMLRGSCDTAPLVQAFARHRTASTAALTADVELWKATAAAEAERGNDYAARYRALTAENQRLREELRRNQAMLEAIDRHNSTNFTEVRQRIVANRAALSTPSEVSEPVADENGGAKGFILWDGKDLRIDSVHFEGLPRELVIEAFMRVATGLATPPNPTNGDAVREALEWFSDQHRLSLEHYSPMYGDDDDQSVEWQVYRESGSINDREWEIVGRGETALAAIQSALATLAKHGVAEG